MESPLKTPDQWLDGVATQLRAGEPSPMITVRSFLLWFHSQRRGRWVVQWIRESLNNVGLPTVPDFESTYIDGFIQFELIAQTTTARALRQSTK